MPKSVKHSSRSQTGPSRSAATRSSTGQTDDSTIFSLSAKNQIEVIHERTTRQDEEELALKRKLVPRLAKRAYHLEDGNTWCADWMQYQKNTHPVFGLCMYHRFHPIRLPQRIIILVGSIAFGFAITNCVILGFLGTEQAGLVNIVYDATGKLAEVQQKYTNVELQQSVVFLLTVGSFTHSMFDMLIWYLMACFCFRPGGGFKVNRVCQNFGIYAAVLVVMLAVVAATSAVIVRLNADESREVEYDASVAEQYAEGKLDEFNETPESTNSTRFSFLVGYLLELVFALFVFYFVTSTVFFSGILGCGRLPVLGGRPYEMRQAATNVNNDDRQSEDEEDAQGLQAYI
mmetsp:Transcript_22582/g.48885  ORF Transcript_22582/g.48885 Transcript_22582/m.48885 type:complete len:345 (-) Transcript_22582:7779-8813(-)